MNISRGWHHNIRLPFVTVDSTVIGRRGSGRRQAEGGCLMTHDGHVEKMRLLVATTWGHVETKCGWWMPHYCHVEAKCGWWVPRASLASAACSTIWPIMHGLYADQHNYIYIVELLSYLFIIENVHVLLLYHT